MHSAIWFFSQFKNVFREKNSQLENTSRIPKKLKDLTKKNLKDLAKKTQGFEKNSMLRSQVTQSDSKKSPNKKPALVSLSSCELWSAFRAPLINLDFGSCIFLVHAQQVRQVCTTLYTCIGHTL